MVARAGKCGQCGGDHFFASRRKRHGNQCFKKELFVIFLKSTSFSGVGAILRDGLYD